MFAKIALTALVIAVVFLLGRVSGMAGERRRRPVARGRAGGWRRRLGRGGMVEDLVECPFCGAQVPATERCRCRDTTQRN